MYLRCFYATGGAVSVNPLFIPVGCEYASVGPPPSPPPPARGGGTRGDGDGGGGGGDGGSATLEARVGARVAALAAWWGWWSAGVGACYTQLKRSQWGTVDVGYILVQNALAESRPRDGAPAEARAGNAAQTRAARAAVPTRNNNPPLAVLSKSLSSSSFSRSSSSSSTSYSSSSSSSSSSFSSFSSSRCMFLLRKAVVLLTTYEQHLLYSVMWCEAPKVGSRPAGFAP